MEKRTSHLSIMVAKLNTRPSGYRMMQIVVCAIVLFGVAAEANWTTIDAPGAPDTFAYGIDGSNVVGWYDDGPESPDPRYHGFVYDGANFTTIDKDGAIGVFATGIEGNNVVGHYRTEDFAYHGFVYAIPEPATLTLLSLGGLALRRRRGR